MCTNRNEDRKDGEDIENLNFRVPRKDVNLPMIDSPWDYMGPITQFLSNIEGVFENQESLALYMHEVGSLEAQRMEADLRHVFEDQDPCVVKTRDTGKSSEAISWTQVIAGASPDHFEPRGDKLVCSIDDVVVEVPEYTRHVLKFMQRAIRPLPIEEDMDKEEETVAIAHRQALELEQSLVSATSRIVAVREKLAGRLQAFRDRRNRKTALNTAKSPETSNTFGDNPQPGSTPEKTQAITTDAAVQTDPHQRVSALNLMRSISTSPAPRQTTEQIAENPSAAGTYQEPEEGTRDAPSDTEQPDNHVPSNTAYEESCANSIIDDPQGDIPHGRPDAMDVDEPGKPVIHPWLGQSHGIDAPILIDWPEDNEYQPSEVSPEPDFDFSLARNRNLRGIPVSSTTNNISPSPLERMYGWAFIEHLRAQGFSWDTIPDEYALKFGVYRKQNSLRRNARTW